MSRDQATEVYIETAANLGKAGVKVVTYNFIPVFDWLRTEMFHPGPDGSTPSTTTSTRWTNSAPRASSTRP